MCLEYRGGPWDGHVVCLGPYPLQYPDVDVCHLGEVTYTYRLAWYPEVRFCYVCTHVDEMPVPGVQPA